MGVFNFMETFFFISLGITFILILLLVYHFKQRLSMVEQKSDTMFDIMNNIVKEMTVIKTMVIQQMSAPPQFPSKFPFASGSTPVNPLNQLFSQMSSANHVMETIPEQNDEPIGKKTDEDDEDETIVDDSDTSSDSNSDDEDYNDEESQNSSDSDETQHENYQVNEEDNKNKIVVSDDDITIENISKINVGETIQLDLEEDNQSVVSEMTVEKKMVEPAIEITFSEEIVEPEVAKQIIPDTLETPVDTIVVGMTFSDDYKKLGTRELKALVLTKGITTDVSKMKKSQLLELLRG